MHPIIVHCDHKNLAFYKEVQKLTTRQARWFEKLQDYDLLWEYIPGSKLIQADALSRRPDHTKDDQEDEQYLMISPEKIITHLR